MAGECKTFDFCESNVTSTKTLIMKSTENNDSVIKFQTGAHAAGNTQFLMGFDKSDNIFKIQQGSEFKTHGASDSPDFEIDEHGHVFIHGDLTVTGSTTSTTSIQTTNSVVSDRLPPGETNSKNTGEYTSIDRSILSNSSI